MQAKRTYKDSLFRNIFNDKTRLKRLYRALSGREVKVRDIKLNTLRGTFFSDVKNDISFRVEDRLIILLEQQSTWNMNMPLRFLWYLARLYRNYVPKNMQYHSNQVKLPTPEFYVLYNGREPQQDYQVLCLEDAFSEQSHGDSELRLHVPCYNVNYAPGREILQKCYELRSYSAFIAKVREKADSGASLETAIREAIAYCISNDFMADYFSENESEVLDMVSAKWDWNEALKVAKEENFEEGVKKGIEQGEAKGSFKTLTNLVKKNLLSLSDAAKEAGISVEDFRKMAML